MKENAQITNETLTFLSQSSIDESFQTEPTKAEQKEMQESFPADFDFADYNAWIDKNNS